ncbi:MAG: hypothetical protein AAFX07_07665 [Pseudomonadota bacterium]
MSRLNPVVLAGIFLVFIALYGGVTWLAGGLYLDTHEGDSYHFVDILLRMAEGQVPHLDFVTPLGVLTFLPISLLMQAGFELGQATVLAQISVAAALVPFIIYVCATRLTGGVGLLFGLFTLCLMLSLSFGSATSGVTISMHYNRWAWSVAFVVLALAMIPPRGAGRPTVDGALVGALCGVLLLLKITYFVTIVPVAALALATRWGLRPIVAAIVGGLVVIAAATVYFGPAFWLAYLHDIRVVSSSDVRPFVGVPLSEIIAGPAYVSATLVGLAAIFLIRKSGQDAVKTAVVLFLPAVIYISYQNFGNDPQWLLFLPVLLLALRPEAGFGAVFGVDLRRAMETTALLAVAVFFPSLFNIAMSPVEHLAFDRERFVPMLPAETGHQDIFIREDRGYMMTARVLKDQEDGPWSVFEERVERSPEPVFEGITFPSCEWMAGSRGFFDVMTADLNRSGIPEGSRIFTADILTAFWLFGPYRPPENGAPWYYGDVSGLENSDYVLIPKCGFVDRVRGIMIDDLANSGRSFELVRDNELYALFAVK